MFSMIYLDNASTSFPKAPSVAESVFTFLKENGRNINRTASEKSYETVSDLISLREDIARLVAHSGEDTVFLNSGLTESINTVLRGFLKRGDHIIIGACEHNAVMRTISSIGLNYSFPTTDGSGRNMLDEIPSLKNERTKAIVFSIASNVTGVNEDVEKLATIASHLRLPFIIDTAQALPYVDIKMDELGISALCFSGHKGLLGPEGTGGFVAEKSFAEKLRPLLTGGTGSFSDSYEQPELFPDKFESGTRNLPGLYGLAASVRYVKDNLETLRAREKRNTMRLLEGLLKIDTITVHGTLDENRNSVISISAKRMDNAELAASLLNKHGVESRVGLHCAATAHKAIGTYPGGTIRLSAGPFTKDDEIDEALIAIREESR